MQFQNIRIYHGITMGWDVNAFFHYSFICTNVMKHSEKAVC